ncbi:MAG TPA: glycogen-binding domain-containing protein [Clostridia bacterium]|nr:glycogen-binding domain-containing protein [Clostridia bacterium]
MIKTTRKSKKTTAKPDVAQAEPARTEPAKTASPAPVSTATPEPTPAAKPAAPRTGQVSLELVRPGAKSVYVAGSFNEWKPERTPLVQVDSGRWVGDLTVKPGRHEYLFVVDGQWMPDPNAKETVQNPFGGRNSILTVSE